MKKYSLLFFCSFFFSLPVFAVYPQPVSSTQGMVVSEQHLASVVGQEILNKGGNAIDAAVAVGYALAVVEPSSGNIGGGGFMLIRLTDGKNVFINFRSKAPLKSTATMYLDKNGEIIPNKSIAGYAAVAVPGTVLGLDYALQKYGTMTRTQVMQPAITLAEKGFTLIQGDMKTLNIAAADFKKEPNVAAIFSKNNEALKVGDTLIQKNLAETLKQISEKGPEAFYKGNVAKSIVQASEKNGGILSLNDFANYTIETLSPIQCHYRGYTIISAPPPSSGGITLCEMLTILEAYPLNQFGFHSAKSAHYMIEAMRYAFYDRNQLGDPDFVKNPVDLLLSKKHAKKIQQAILPDKATSSDTFKSSQSAQEGEHTTHYSIIDGKGNAVAVTYTLNRYFGARVIADNTGFFLNDDMDDFTLKPHTPNQFGLVQGDANIIAPGKRPLSSMTPTFLLKDNQLLMVLGSPGGPRIITAILQTIINVIDYGWDIQSAVDAPRFHHQWLPDIVDEEEPYVFSADTKEKLAQMGYQFKMRPIWGAVESIYIDPVSHMRYGANDNRRPAGKAAANK